MQVYKKERNYITFNQKFQKISSTYKNINKLTKETSK